jgi:ribonuclease D
MNDHHESERGHEDLQSLPLTRFEGTIHLIETEEQARLALESVRRFAASHRPIGMDTEARPSFRPGEKFPTCLVQISTDADAFLFRIPDRRPQEALRTLLEDPAIRKVAQGAPQELRSLREDLGIEARGLVDLPALAKSAGAAALNLRALAAQYLGIRISKAEQRSDWSARALSARQLRYAATDAWACLVVYDKLMEQNPELRGRKGGAAAEPATVRRAAWRDAKAVADLIGKLAEANGEKSAVDARLVRAWLRGRGQGILAAVRGKSVVGALSWSIRRNLYHAAPCCTVEELVVEAESRSDGVGSALIQAAVEMAQKKGCAEISVSTLFNNRRARSFYRKAGFTDEALLLERHFPASKA